MASDRTTSLVSTLHSILKPFLLRRLKVDVEFDLPPKKEYVLYAPLTEKQKSVYEAVLNRSLRQYLIAGSQGQTEKERKDEEERKRKERRKKGKGKLGRYLENAGDLLPANRTKDYPHRTRLAAHGMPTFYQSCVDWKFETYLHIYQNNIAHNKGLLSLEGRYFTHSRVV